MSSKVGEVLVCIDEAKCDLLRWMAKSIVNKYVVGNVVGIEDVIGTVKVWKDVIVKELIKILEKEFGVEVER